MQTANGSLPQRSESTYRSSSGWRVRLASLATIVVLITIAALSAAALSGCGNENTSSNRWLADMTYLIGVFEANRFDGFAPLSEADFARRATALAAEASELDDAEMQVGVMRLLTDFGDAHTAAWGAVYRGYPVQLRWFPDGVYVVAAAKPAKSLLGKRLVAIDGNSVERVWQAVSSVVSHENTAWLRARTPAYIADGDVLRGVGIASSASRARWTFSSRDGARTSLTLQAKPVPKGTVFLPAWTLRHRETPLADRRLKKRNWWTRIDRGRTLFVAFNQCREVKAFAAVSKQIAVSLRRQRAERVVVDLRGNGGGYFNTVYPLERLLSERSPESFDSLYVLIGRNTFSAGVYAAIQLAQVPHAVLVGEPTGGKPNALGEATIYTLPNSGMRVLYTTAYPYYYPKLKYEPSLEPKVKIDRTIADYLAGRDPVLDYARRAPPVE